MPMENLMEEFEPTSGIKPEILERASIQILIQKVKAVVYEKDELQLRDVSNEMTFAITGLS